MWPQSNAFRLCVCYIEFVCVWLPTQWNQPEKWPNTSKVDIFVESTYLATFCIVRCKRLTDVFCLLHFYTSGTWPSRNHVLLLRYLFHDHEFGSSPAYFTESAALLCWFCGISRLFPASVSAWSQQRDNLFLTVHQCKQELSKIHRF